MEVYHEEFGVGEILKSTELFDEAGNIVLADVMFEDHIEIDLPLFEDVASTIPNPYRKSNLPKNVVKDGARGRETYGEEIESLPEDSINHAELAQKAHSSYVSALRQGNGTMAAHYLNQHTKHKAALKTAANKKKMTKEEIEDLDEKLVGKQKNIDANDNGKIDAEDFVKLRGKKDGDNKSMKSEGAGNKTTSESVIQPGNKYQSNLMHQVKLEAHPLTGLAKGESPMSDSEVRSHYAKHRPESFVAKNPTAPLTNDHKRYAHIDRTFLSKLSDNNAKNKARDDKFYGTTNEGISLFSKPGKSQFSKPGKRLLSKPGKRPERDESSLMHQVRLAAHPLTGLAKGESPMSDSEVRAHYAKHGPQSKLAQNPTMPVTDDHRKIAHITRTFLSKLDGKYQDKNINETSTSKLKKYISKAEDDRESADNNDYRGSEYNDHDMDYVHDKSGDAKVQARGAKRDKYIKIAQTKLDAKKQMKESVEVTPRVTPDSASMRMPAVENVIRDIMSQQRNLRQEAKLEDFKSRNK